MTKFALLIGVSECVDYPPLPSAVADVDAMQGILVDPQRGEFLVENIQSLKNPNRQDMENAIYWLFYNREQEDLLLFYFSGHGIRNHDNRKQLYLATGITCKHASGFLQHPSAVAATYLRDQMEFSNSQKQVIILDCCFSGAIAYGMSIKDDGTVKVEDYLLEKGGEDGKGRAILTSSTAIETSMAGNLNPDGSIGLSIYTRYLVEGLTTGAADLDKSGEISVKELYDYASKKVKIAAPAMSPEFYRVSDGEKIVVAKSPTDPKLEYERYFRDRIDSKGNLYNSIQRQTLITKQKNLGISPEDAGRIEERVLQPYRDYQQKLEEYKHYLTLAVQEDYSLVPLLADLKEYQQALRLQDEDIAEIHGRLLLSLSTFSFETAQVKVIKVKSGLFGGTKIQIEVVKNPGSAQYFVEELGNGVNLEMVHVPGGQFMMGLEEDDGGQLMMGLFGKDDELPPHPVNVSSFFMSKYPVTQAQYQSILGSKPSFFKGFQRPVESVSWNDTQAFCQKLANQTNKPYRLPSEAEWEYACRAGTKTPFYFGETITTDVVNYYGNYPYAPAPEGVSHKSTSDVGIFPANSFGLYDLHGNVWEWCQDTWHENYLGAPIDGRPWVNDNTPVKVTKVCLSSEKPESSNMRMFGVILLFIGRFFRSSW